MALSSSTSLNSSGAARKGASKIGFKAGVRGIEQFPARNYHDVESRPGAALAENLSDQPFSPISSNRIAELSGGHDAEPGGAGPVYRHNQRHEPAMNPKPGVEHALKIRPLPKASIGTERTGPGRRKLTLSEVHWRPRIRASRRVYDEETVRRFRPFARRRLRTSLPFFVLMRTRNPCVRRRRRRFGWNVRFMMSDPLLRREITQRNLDGNRILVNLQLPRPNFQNAANPPSPGDCELAVGS
jgi:hypothetical protein